jgi:hypothetical protein
MILSPDSSGHPQLPESTTDNTTTMSNHREPALNLGTCVTKANTFTPLHNDDVLVGVFNTFTFLLLTHFT